jgi:polyisoprenoid-binding protein YceI
MTTMTAAAPTTSTWTIDASHTEVEFSVRHLMISNVKGRFGAVKGEVVLDQSTPTKAQIDVSIDVTSIDTREEKRDTHLRSADFFDAGHFPAMTFTGGTLKGNFEGEFTLTGDLTIRGVTKPITLDVTFEGAGNDPWGGSRRGFSAKGKLMRSAFGLEWNAALETGGVVVGDEVKITINTELVLQK